MSSEPTPKKKKVQSTLTSFLSAARPTLDKNESLSSSSSAAPVTSIPLESKDSAVPETGERRIHLTFNKDIGHAVSRNLTPEDRALFINPWVPEQQEDFPSSTHIKSGVSRQRRLLPRHLKDFPWLAVSKVDGKEGAYCVPCVLFLSSGVGGRSGGQGQRARTFVSQPLTRFDDLTGKNGVLPNHDKSDYHKRCVLSMEDFIKLTLKEKVLKT